MEQGVSMADGNHLKHIVWDWNGTLLDDVALCVSALNVLCERRGMRQIGRKEYRDKFTFPVIEYYEAVGFDFEKEPFSIPAGDWVEQYTTRVRSEAGLYPGVLDVLSWVRAAGIGQSLLSAHHGKTLQELTRHYGVERFLAPILGLSDFYAQSKVELGMQWLEASGLRAEEVLLIGDTLHDWEAAQSMGTQCVLLAQGHQSRWRLERTGLPILDGMEDVLPFLGKGHAAGTAEGGCPR